MDDNLYEKAHEFDGFRFSRMRERDGDSAKLYSVNSSTEFLQFGHGKNVWYAHFINALTLCSPGRAAIVLAGKLDAHAFGLGLARGQFAFIDGASEQKPGGDLHQTGGQAHAFGRVGESGRARKYARLFSARTVEVGCSLFDERHSFSKEIFECGGRRKTVNEWNRRRRRRGRGKTALRSFVLMTHTLSLPPTEARPLRWPPLSWSPSHHSSRAVPSGHLPLSKVNRKVRVLHADKKSRPEWRL